MASSEERMPTEETPDNEAEVVEDDEGRRLPGDGAAERELPEAEGPDFEAHAGWGSAG